ncbi:MAG: type IV pilin N-terminal domain-containing protein [Thaumarchaeota archaeon]|nr:type IV pilin N-terminal domain-containing protein [Nitrososphaerota archaeon]
MKIKYGQRKAISPIIATVLIIAVTLIAAVAIGGFVFGLFGSSTNTAQISAVNAALSSTGTVTPNTFTVACATAASTTAGVGNIQFSNSGSANAAITTVSLTYGGKTYSSAAPTSGCTVTAGSSLYITISVYPAALTSGQQFTGFVVTNNGAQVVFTGTFA